MGRPVRRACAACSSPRIRSSTHAEAPMTTATTKNASIEIPESGATREPTQRPRSGAPVQILSVTTAIAVTSATRSSRTFTVRSLSPRGAYGLVRRSAHFRALAASLPAWLTHLEYFSRLALFDEPEPLEPEPEPEEPEPDAPPRPPSPRPPSWETSSSNGLALAGSEISWSSLRSEIARSSLKSADPPAEFEDLGVTTPM